MKLLYYQVNRQAKPHKIKTGSHVTTESNVTGSVCTVSGSMYTIESVKMMGE